jgi:hypothetical protein
MIHNRTIGYAREETRDITVRATAVGLDPKSTKVRDVMSTDVVYCFDDEEVRDAANIMQEKQIRRPRTTRCVIYLPGQLANNPAKQPQP